MMADFLEAFARTMAHEGGYVNDPDDVGGETYRGISRRYNPSWSGWQEIDKLRASANFPMCLETSATLQADVTAHYRQHYWDRFQGDRLPHQEIAEELFDTSVNLGVTRAITFLQAGLNLLNRNGELFTDLVEDGRLGPRTLEALEMYLACDRSDYLLTVMNVLQGSHYLEFMHRNPEQEKFARGWLSRVCLSRH
jgi:lysozyme family protein